MTSCDVVLPDGTHRTIKFARVPAVNERVVFGAEDVESGPWGEHQGKRYHVGGVSWKTMAPGFDAGAIVSLVDG